MSNKAIAGELGGYGRHISLILLTASKSTPANTVKSLSGFFSEIVKECFTPGLAAPAAQPHTELIKTKHFPDSSLSSETTVSASFSSVKPTEVNSSIIAIVNSYS